VYTNGCHSYEGIANRRNCPELFNSESYYIFDAKAGDNCREPFRCPAFLLLFSSPNIASYKQKARNNVPKVGFTSPSKEELMILGKALKIKEEVIIEKYNKYGPDIRFVIAVSLIFTCYV
jgi:hypothetical protein